MSLSLASIDPEDIRNMTGGQQARSQKRREIINEYLTAVKKDKKRFMRQQSEENTILTNYFWYVRMMAGISALGSWLIYNSFFKGIYNFRATELLNMNNVPKPLRMGASIGIGMCLFFPL